MHRSRIRIALVLGSLALALLAPAAHAFSARNPQATVCTPSLQNYFDGIGQTIIVGTQQMDAQVWSTTVSGNTTLTLMLELAANASSNSIGVYNALDAVPALRQVFPGPAAPGWYATAHFGSTGTLIVSLFDDQSNFMGQSTYTGVDRLHFGFYLQGPGGTFFSEDYRNGNKAQMLAYQGTGVDQGNWWLAFEDQAVSNTNCPDYDDAVLEMQSLNPVTGAHSVTWGAIKRLYH